MILTIARQDDQQQYAECIAVFIAPISTILVSRFMMNLRHLSYFNENCTFSSFLHSFYQDFSLNIYESDHPTCNIKHKDVLNASEAFVVTSEEVHNCLNGSDLIERVNRSSDNVQIEEVELCTFLQT
ncbi:hypothetical protein AcV5_001856 [Taiwanofungus camphoratus]|nr:hypothetical protein AcV5_001856 [Antrodia cinnamomea]